MRPLSTTLGERLVHKPEVQAVVRFFTWLHDIDQQHRQQQRQLRAAKYQRDVLIARKVQAERRIAAAMTAAAKAKQQHKAQGPAIQAAQDAADIAESLRWDIGLAVEAVRKHAR
jgi:hypothetical protein